MSSFSFSPTSPTYPRPLSVDVNGNITTEDVHAQLRALHSDELVSISPPTVLGTFYGWVKGYMKFLWMIWGHVITLGLDTDTETFEWTLVFAIITTVLLVPMLIFCMLLSLPAVQAPAFKLYAYAVTTPMYESWWNGDKRALAASRAALCKPAEGRGSKFGSGYDNRHFDLDIARLLLQFSGLVYEHDSTAVRRALAIIKANTPLDIFGTLRGRGRVSLDKFIGEVPAQLARAALTGEEIVADVLGVDSRGRVAATLSPTLLPPPPPPSGASPAGSDNVIRGHLAGSGIEYEPVSELNGVGSAFAALFWHPHEPWIVVAFKGTSPTEFDEWVTDLTFTREDIGTHIPGFGKVHSGFKARVFPDEARAPRSLREHLKRHAEQLRDWWKPPSEAERKLRDLPVRTPYDTIRDSIQIVADNLTKNTGIHSINVYFTGHSLGCATASLAYARAVAKQNTDYKSNVRIRDAYLFAAPVIGDVKTRDAFNRIMGMGLPRSMWRVTNGPDAVAGMLPEMGDRVPLSVHPENPVAFAHLGLELKMAPAGPKGQGAQVEAVVAPHRPVWEPVTIVQATHYGREEEKGGRSGTTNDDDSGVFSETASERSTRARIVNRARLNLASVKELPFGIGYVLWLGVSHIISCYWDQILYVEPGECVWVEN